MLRSSLRLLGGSLFLLSLGACAQAKKSVIYESPFENAGAAGQAQGGAGQAGQDAAGAPTAGQTNQGGQAGETPQGGQGGTSGNSGQSGSGGKAGGASSGGQAGTSSGGQAGEGGTSGSSGQGGAGQGGAGQGGAGGSATAGASGAGPCDGKVVINEVSAESKTDGNADFVELYNPTGCPIDLTGWKLMYRSSSSPGAVELRWAAPDKFSLASKAFLVLGTPSFEGDIQGELANGLKAAGGGLELVDADKQVVDSVAWGDVPTSHPDIEGQKCDSLDGVPSASRFPDGHDTDNNKTDFALPTSSTPGAPNSSN